MKENNNLHDYVLSLRKRNNHTHMIKKHKNVSVNELHLKLDQNTDTKLPFLLTRKFIQDIDILGTLTATGKGYKGGQRPANGYDTGFQGESFAGSSNQIITANIGGGGAGRGESGGHAHYGNPGGGGGYGENG